MAFELTFLANNFEVKNISQRQGYVQTKLKF